MLRVSPLEPASSQSHFGFTTRDSGAAIPAASVCKGRPGSPPPAHTAAGAWRDTEPPAASVISQELRAEQLSCPGKDALPKYSSSSHRAWPGEPQSHN